jgi:regulator of sigma E protease
VLSLIYFILVLSVLVLVHEFGHFAAAKRLGVRVDIFSFGFGPKLFEVKKGDTSYVLSAIPLGGYIKMAGDEPNEALKHQKWEFLSRKVSERAQIIAAGPVLNYILAFVIFAVIFMFGSPTLTTEVGGLLKDYPAEKYGIMKGDKVIAIDGKGVRFWEDMAETINRHPGGTMRILFERSGHRMEKDIVPVVRKTKDIFGKEVSVSLIGITPSQEIIKVRYGFVDSLKMGWKKLISLTVVTFKALWSIMIGRLSMRESMTGPIGIFVVTGQAAKLGLIYIFHLMGILSASLAIFNILPLPVLDGGHIIFLILEKLRGRPLSVRTQEIITNIGISFLIVLTVFIFYNDIVKFGVGAKIIGIFKK